MNFLMSDLLQHGNIKTLSILISLDFTNKDSLCFQLVSLIFSAALVLQSETSLRAFGSDSVFSDKS